MINSHQTVVLWSSEWGRAGEGGEGIIYTCIIFSLCVICYLRDMLGARGKRGGFSPGAATRHSQSARAQKFVKKKVFFECPDIRNKRFFSQIFGLSQSNQGKKEGRKRKKEKDCGVQCQSGPIDVWLQFWELLIREKHRVEPAQPEFFNEKGVEPAEPEF